VRAGNHDVKLVRKLAGATCRSRTAWPRRWRSSKRHARSAAQIAQFLDSLVSHYVLDGGQLVVAHAGMKERTRPRRRRVREFALYGETTGETDEFGLPVRYNWAASIAARRGRLRPHAGARAGLAQPHDQHRHRLRVRRAS
jgi:protein phosphatase